VFEMFGLSTLFTISLAIIVGYTKVASTETSLAG
jgi:hypothetical protein